jgi:predicted RNA-binding Zn-ribbon protein involved in translation (DUF1610 family)
MFSKDSPPMIRAVAGTTIRCSKKHVVATIQAEANLSALGEVRTFVCPTCGESIKLKLAGGHGG